MSDEEYENTSNTSRTSKKGDEAFARAKSGSKDDRLSFNGSNGEMMKMITVPVSVRFI